MELNTIADLNPGEIAQQEVEIDNDVRELENFKEEIQETEQDIEVVQDVTEVVEKEGADISPAAVRMTEVVMESLYNRLGLKLDHDKVSLESFGGKMTKRDASRIAIEDFKATIARVWEALKRAVGQVWLRIKNFVIRLFGMFGQMEKQVKNMREKLVALDKNAKPEETEFTDSSLGVAFSDQGKDVSGNDLLLRQDNHIKVVKNYDAASHEIERAMQYLDNLTARIKDNPTETNKGNFEAFREGMDKVFGVLRQKICPFKVNGMKDVYVSGFMVGGKAYGMKTMSLDTRMKFFDEEIGSVSEWGWTFYNYFISDKKPSNKIAVLTRQEMTKGLENCDELLRETNGIKSREAFITKIDKAFEKAIDNCKKATTEKKSFADENDIDKFVNELKYIISVYNRSFSKIAVEIPQDALKCVSRSLQYINKSISYYTGDNKGMNATPQMNNLLGSKA